MPDLATQSERPVQPLARAGGGDRTEVDGGATPGGRGAVDGQVAAGGRNDVAETEVRTAAGGFEERGGGTAADARRNCSECGVCIPDGAARCWLCGRSALLAHLPSRSTHGRFPRTSFRFQLHSVFLTTALLAACLAVARPFPSVAMALVVPLATAYLRTLQISLEFGAVSRPLGAFAKIALFAKSLGVALVMLVGSCSALIVAIGVGAGVGIMVGEWREDPTYILIGFGAGTSIGVFGSLAVAAWTGQRFWPGPRAERPAPE